MSTNRYQCEHHYKLLIYWAKIKKLSINPGFALHVGSLIFYEQI